MSENYYKAEDVINLFEKYHYEMATSVLKYKNELESLPTIEVSEDAVSREWVINKQKEIIDLYTPHKTVEGRGQIHWQIGERELVIKELENAPSVVPNIESYKNWVDLDNATIIAECVHHYGGKAVVEACEKYIKEKDDVAMCDGYRCDRCGFFVPWDYEHKSIDFINDYHFCPNCGARMKGADDE